MKRKDKNFEANKANLKRELARLQSGKAETYTIEQADKMLEETIRKYASSK